MPATARRRCRSSMRASQIGLLLRDVGARRNRCSRTGCSPGARSAPASASALPRRHFRVGGVERRRAGVACLHDLGVVGVHRDDRTGFTCGVELHEIAADVGVVGRLVITRIGRVVGAVCRNRYDDGRTEQREQQLALARIRFARGGGLRRVFGCLSPSSTLAGAACASWRSGVLISLMSILQADSVGLFGPLNARRNGWIRA